MKYLAVSLILILHVASAQAGRESGGGSLLESAFRIRGLELIDKVKNNSNANKLCSFAEMQSGLENSKIRVVDTLVDLISGQPIQGQHLDAWSQPGDIQLKLSSWSKFLKGAYALDNSVNALVLHEIYRTTHNCDDDKGRISTQVISYLQYATTPVIDPYGKYSIIFTFSYSVSVPDKVKGHLACDSAMDIAHPKAGIICVFVGQDPSSVVNIVEIQTESSLFKNRIRYLTKPEGDWFKLMNLADRASEKEPLYMVFDRKSGYLAYGVSLDELKIIPQY